MNSKAISINDIFIDKESPNIRDMISDLIDYKSSIINNQEPDIDTDGLYNGLVGYIIGEISNKNINMDIFNDMKREPKE